MVEGKDVELAVVAKTHDHSPIRGGRFPSVIAGYPPTLREAQLHRSELHARSRGGADDPRLRELQPDQRHRGAGRGVTRRRDQARADGVGARDRHEPVPGRARGRDAAARAAPAGRRDGRRARACASARPGRIRSPCGRTSASRAPSATASWSARCASSRARRSSSASTSTSGSTTPTRRSTSPTACACTSRSCSRCRPTRRSGASQATGLASTRMPIFRAFPRTGMPPTYRDWDDFESRIGFMVESGVIQDYTFLWYDIRPHPNFGTVEVRAMDAQTRVEHTMALAALIQAMVKELAEHYDAGGELATYPHEMLEENRWLAARHGLDGQLVDLPHKRLVATKELARRLYRPPAPARRRSSAPRIEFDGAQGHHRARDGRLAPADGVRGQPRLHRGRARDRGRHAGVVATPRAPRRIVMPMSSGPDLFVVCKNCRAEVSPYITECPVLRHAAAQARAEAREGRRAEGAALGPPQAAAPAAGASAAGRDAGHPRRVAAVDHDLARPRGGRAVGARSAPASTSRRWR